MSATKGIASRWNARYFLEYAVALSVYLASIAICLPRAHETSSRSGRALLLLPVCIGILLMSAAVTRHFLRIDEYLRRAMTESFAVAGALTLICALAYGYFEGVGFPRVSAWFALPVMAIGILLWWLSRWLFKVFRKG